MNMSIPRSPHERRYSPKPVSGTTGGRRCRQCFRGFVATVPAEFSVTVRVGAIIFRVTPSALGGAFDGLLVMQFPRPPRSYAKTAWPLASSYMSSPWLLKLGVLIMG